MYIVLYNPLSRSCKKISKLERMLKRNNKEYEKFSVLEKLDVDEFINDYKDKIIIVGGDGTLNVIFNYVRNIEIKNQIYLFKAGTGNDFARSFKGQLIDITNYVKRLPEVTIKNKNENFIFLNGCGMGIDAFVCNSVNLTNKKSKLFFFWNAIKSFFKFKRFDIQVEIDGEVLNFEKVWFCSIMNGQYQGGGMKMSPKSDRFDDYLELLVIYKLSAFLIFVLFPIIYMGIHTKFKKWIYYKSAKNINIKSNRKNLIQFDGEVIENVDEIQVCFKEESK